MKKVFFLLAILSFPLASFAKPKIKIIQTKDKVIYKKNTTINFNEAIVDGELIKPHGGFHQSKARAKFNSLIMYRKDFLDKMIKQAKKL